MIEIINKYSAPVIRFAGEHIASVSIGVIVILALVVFFTIRFRKQLKELFFKYKMTIMYLVFGGLTTLVNIIAFVIVKQATDNTAVSNITAWFLAVVFAFVTNKLFVFDTDDSAKTSLIFQILTFFAARVVSGAIDTVIVVIFIDKLGLNQVLVKIMSNIIVLILNFIASKLIIFRKRN